MKHLLTLVESIPDSMKNQEITYWALKALLEEAVKRQEYDDYEDYMGQNM